MSKIILLCSAPKASSAVMASRKCHGNQFLSQRAASLIMVSCHKQMESACPFSVELDLVSMKGNMIVMLS